MRRHQLIDALQASPFRPFRLRVSDGTTFDIRHPEMLMVGRHAAIVGILESAETAMPTTRIPRSNDSPRVDLLHVTQLEELRRRPKS